MAVELLKNDFLKGDVYILALQDLDMFFEKYYPYKMTNAGVSSFLKALKIPETYFLKQPDETRMELLVNQKNSMTCNKDLILLVRNDIVEYVSLGDRTSILDSIDRSNINEDWMFLEEDLKSGYIRYFMFSEKFDDVDKLIEGKSYLGLFIDYPVLFSKPMIINAGFYKATSELNEDGLPIELIIPDTQIKLKAKELPETVNNRYLQDILEAIKKTNLDTLIGTLEGITTDSTSCIESLLLFEKDKTLNRSISKKVRKYIDKEELNIDNMSELSEILVSFINTLTSYSSKVKFKRDILFSILKFTNKLPVITYVQDFIEVY